MNYIGMEPKIKYLIKIEDSNSASVVARNYPGRMSKNYLQKYCSPELWL